MQYYIECCGFGLNAKIQNGEEMLANYLTAHGKPPVSNEEQCNSFAFQVFKRRLRLQGDPQGVWDIGKLRWKHAKVMASVVRSIPFLETAQGGVQFVLGRMANLRDQGYYLWYAMKMIGSSSSPSQMTAEQKSVFKATRSAPLEVMLDPEGGWNIEMNDVFVFMALDVMMKTTDINTPNYFPIRMVLSIDHANGWFTCDNDVHVIESISNQIARGVLPGNVLVFSKNDAGYYSNVTSRELCQLLSYDDGKIEAYYARSHPHILFFKHSNSKAYTDKKKFCRLRIAKNRKAVYIPSKWIRNLSRSETVSDKDCEENTTYRDEYTRVGDLPHFTITEDSCNLKNLFEDMSWYSTTKEERSKTNAKWGDHHHGTLIEHSRWTADIVRRWFDSKDARVLSIDPRYYDLVVLCALLHDIGKAGDLNRSIYKPDHPQTAMEYATGRRAYKVSSPTIPSFRTLHQFLSYDCIGLTPSVLAVAAVVGACHYDLGFVLRGDITPCEWSRRFIQACTEVVDGANYALISQLSKSAMMQLARIVLCISMADVIGSWPPETDAANDVKGPWQRYGYAKKWASVCSRILRAVATTIGLPRNSELVTMIAHIKCHDTT